MSDLIQELDGAMKKALSKLVEAAEVLNDCYEKHLDADDIIEENDAIYAYLIGFTEAINLCGAMLNRARYRLETIKQEQAEN